MCKDLERAGPKATQTIPATPLAYKPGSLGTHRPPHTVTPCYTRIQPIFKVQYTHIMSAAPSFRPTSGVMASARRQVRIQSPIEASMDRLRIDYWSLWKASCSHIHFSVQTES
jgi:hypothetical protein